MVAILWANDIQDFLDVSAGDHHTCGLTSKGIARCFGKDVNNQCYHQNPKTPTFSREILEEYVLNTGVGTKETSAKMFDDLSRLATPISHFCKLVQGEHTCAPSYFGPLECFGMTMTVKAMRTSQEKRTMARSHK